MKKYMVEIATDDNFEVGKCSECRFRSDRDQCDLKAFLADGDCKLNCFCPLIGKETFTL